ncbi:MAG: DUF4350 domain-containing protein [Brevundimonas sp.]|nr:DUF4350 domain-containing protein [Brevundimonas sp.]
MPRLPFVPALAALLLMAAPAAAQQVVDPDFRPRVERPAYAGDGPLVVIDGAHHNFHTVDGQYAPFAALLRADGYRVEGGSRPFDQGGLDGVEVLVVANAGAIHDPSGPIFTEEEIGALEAWVRAGGRLLLIADHAPFGAAAEPLAAAFGVRMGKGYAFAPTSTGVSTNLVYPAEAFDDHPIIAGREADERVESVTAFTGQSLAGPEGATVLLPMTVGAREAPDQPTLQRISERIAAGEGAEAVIAELSSPALPAQALAFTHGAGRVVVLGEAGMLSAQRVRFPDGREVRFGMNVAPGNARFGLNILHWLTGLLP